MGYVGVRVRDGVRVRVCMFHNRNHHHCICNEFLKSELKHQNHKNVVSVWREEKKATKIMYVWRTSDTTWNMIRFAGPNALMAKLISAHQRFSNLALL